jgi:hypothetical protein
MENLFDKKVMVTTEMFQKSCHEFIEMLSAVSPNMSYQDATNVWIFKKLAEIQVMLSEIKK